MSGPKLFRLRDAAVVRIPARAPSPEKALQHLLQQHLPTFLGVRFLATYLLVNAGRDRHGVWILPDAVAELGVAALGG